MRKSCGITLVELQVSVIIGVIFVLIVGILGTTSLGISRKAQDEGAIFNDLTYAFETMQHKVRSGYFLTTGCPGTGPWTGQCLVVDGELYFGVQSGLGLVYYDNDGAETNLLFMAQAPDDIDLTIYSWSQDYASLSLSGVRNNIAFDVPNTIKRRAL